MRPALKYAIHYSVRKFQPLYLFVAMISTALLVTNSSCSSSSDSEDEDSTTSVSDYRQEMRSLVIAISEYAKEESPGFLIIPQNGHDVISENSDPTETMDSAYLAAIDGLGREDLYYGYDSDDTATDPSVTEAINAFLTIYEQNNVSVLVTDYISTNNEIDNSYAQNRTQGYVSFAASRRELDNIPSYPSSPHNENANDITTLAEAQNFLYILNPSNTDYFADKASYLNALAATNYDLFIIDLFYEETPLSTTEIQSLKTKANGGSRLVIAYMSIGEAENYRDYWQEAWQVGSPSWIEEENIDFPGNFKVEYWNADWQALLFGAPEAYLDKIIAAGFDGVYLDIIDAFEYFES